ncbi:uncharacterized protein LOC117171119 [Belonocnema kinseyi]|uniref:uncharacterized protein LOC117171119 n=1 Tax=Belonocnema kinseyi TaxID=2817044 RepID=UPI00143DE043|nr:uncharacterized protein LOC117171119 [Belonocnema kinseyi]
MWFAQVETQFALAGVLLDETKFNYVAGNLDAKLAAEVRDILTSAPGTERTYQRLKTELINRLSASQDQKTLRLLEHEEIGDRTPSQFLRHLRGLAGNVFPDAVLRPLWLGQLHAPMQAILATQDQAQLDKLAQLADAIAEATPKTCVSEVSANLAPLEAMLQQLALVTSRIAEVSVTLSEVASGSRDRGRSPSRGRFRDRSRSRSRRNHEDGVCWYHETFGSDAKKCNLPCAFKSGNEPGRC